MTNARSESLLPPFSPILFAGLALRPLPVKFLSRLLTIFLGRMKRLYPEIANRLTPLGHCRFHIIPTDFPFSFLVILDNGKATAKILNKGQAVSNITASISGDIYSLIQLLEGSVDGDTLFFTRRLIVEGDTEAVLTLRNAIDSVDLSIKHILTGLTGPLTPLFKRAATPLSSFHRTALKDFSILQQSLVGPVTRRISQMDEEISRQEKRLIQQGKEIKKIQASVKRGDKVAGEN
ncbi:SCP2 sterol-binding domain-containing protein [Sneathiella sp.]|uniref:ubiquinone anaerobic biosynthesis accessory factor UbiT n=1 Tax=Sneathiella sp. TaxID=1964365 RepID=UPI0026122B55|nr:SCP2 sterol-binding domain-containing protein [Sneathiella sp.]MDF2368451.1 SCP2 sterol-binding domain-containing protein [Sneathiella sp.]